MSYTVTLSPPLVATFISFLLEVESTFEVHDYVKSYLGETRDAYNFAKQFLERWKKIEASLAIVTFIVPLYNICTVKLHLVDTPLSSGHLLYIPT